MGETVVLWNFVYLVLQSNIYDCVLGDKGQKNLEDARDVSQFDSSTVECVIHY